MVHGLIQFPGAGCIVEFMHDNGPQVAWVLEENNGKLRLLLPSRREMNPPQTRLLPWSGPSYAGVTGRDNAIDHLQRHKELRTAAKQTFNILELWEMAQGEVVKASAVWFAELVASNPDIDLVAACGQALLDCKSHFKFVPPEFEIFSEEIASKRQADQEAHRIREELARQGQAWIAYMWDRYCKRQCKQPPALSPEVRGQLEALIMDRLANPETTEDDAQWRLLVKGLPDDPMLPLYLAEAWGLVGPHYNYWLDRIGYAPGDAWSEAHDKEIAALVSRSERPDLPRSDIPFISVDSESTKDIDDALHVEARPDGGWIARLALACPALDWPFGGELDKAVLYRGTCIYLPEAVYHMLPERLSVDAYTLAADKERPALLVECHIAPDGSVESCVPSLATVMVRANVSYEAVDLCLNGQESPASPFAESLRQAHTLGRARQEYRVRHNAVIIDRPDPECRLLEREGGEIEVELHDGQLDPGAHLMVSDLMILANSALADWAESQGAALLYRTQDVTVPKEYAGIWTNPEDIARVVRVLIPASLESAPRPHAGLGEQRYAPTTSPLRRYPDLLNESQIVHLIREKKPKWTKTDLDDLLPLLNSRLDAAGQVQRMRPRYWKLLYLKQHDASWWPGVITDENDAFVSVSLPREQLFLRARRSLFGGRCHIGQQVEVKLHKIHPIRNEVHIADVREP